MVCLRRDEFEFSDCVMVCLWCDEFEFSDCYGVVWRVYGVMSLSLVTVMVLYGVSMV
jgi:uncharacterized Fe-S radical SAM superfamily protein PflX